MAPFRVYEDHHFFHEFVPLWQIIQLVGILEQSVESVSFEVFNICDILDVEGLFDDSPLLLVLAEILLLESGVDYVHSEVIVLRVSNFINF